MHIIGFQGIPQGLDRFKWKADGKLYAGAMYAIRTADQTYTVNEVNGAYSPGKPILVSPRTFARSPFGDNFLFVAGHDSSFTQSDDMAWVFKAPFSTALVPAKVSRDNP